MNHLSDGPILNVVELASSVQPMWYHGDQNVVVYAYNSVKEAILVNNGILYDEISLAKRNHNNHGISKLWITLRCLFIYLFSDKYDESQDSL